jgi:hypothetical protein
MRREDVARIAFNAPRVADTLSERAVDAALVGRHSILLSVDEALAIASDLEELGTAAFALHHELTKGKAT